VADTEPYIDGKVLDWVEDSCGESAPAAAAEEAKAPQEEAEAPQGEATPIQEPLREAASGTAAASASSADGQRRAADGMDVDRKSEHVGEEQGLDQEAEDPELQAILAKLSEEERAKLQQRDASREASLAKRLKTAHDPALEAIQEQVLQFGKAITEAAAGSWRTGPYSG